MSFKRNHIQAYSVSSAICAAGLILSTILSGQAAEGPWPMTELRKVPQVTWRNGTDRVRSLLYRGMPFEGKPTSVFAYYATPGTLSYGEISDRKLPAVIFVHGGGGRASADVCELWARRGYAALAMDLGGCSDELMPDNLTLKPLPDGGPSQDGYRKFRDIDKPVTDQWPFHAVASVVLANSLLRSFPEIDPGRIGVTGSSWGGYTTCLAAGIDDRFAAAAPVYGCGYIFEHSVWKEEMLLFGEMTPQNRQRWTDLWDPSRVIGSAAMPMLFLSGASDFAYPLESFYKTFTTAPEGANRWLSLHNPLPHDDGTAARALEVEVFMDQCLRNGPALPRVGHPVTGTDSITATVTSPVPLLTAALYYTHDQSVKKWADRRWTRVAGTVAPGRATTPLPPADCYAWYLAVTDSRGAEAAGPVIFSGEPRPAILPHITVAPKGTAFLNASWNIECVQERYRVILNGRTGRLISLVVDDTELLAQQNLATDGVMVYHGDSPMAASSVPILLASGTTQQAAAMDGDMGMWFHFLPDAIIIEYAVGHPTNPGLLCNFSPRVEGFQILENLDDRHLKVQARHKGWVIGSGGARLVTALPTSVAVQGLAPTPVTEWNGSAVNALSLDFPVGKRVALEIQIGSALLPEKP